MGLFLSNLPMCSYISCFSSIIRTEREGFHVSVNTLILIPTEPTYRPGSVLAEQAKALFKTFVPQAKEITIQETEEIQFVATGENLERIICPFCKSLLDEQWWIAAMDTAYETTKFANLTVTLPCCGRVVSLNDLCYDWPTGFACFQLIARDPGND